jgi:hypothetical protein
MNLKVVAALTSAAGGELIKKIKIIKKIAPPGQIIAPPGQIIAPPGQIIKIIKIIKKKGGTQIACDGSVRKQKLANPTPYLFF